MKKLFIYGGAFGAAVALFCLTLSPYLMNGFWGDDCLNSAIAGVKARTGQSVWDFAWFINGEWVRNSGRFFPFGWLTGYYSFYLFQAVEYYRLYQVTLAFVHISLFAWLVYELAGNVRLAALAAVILPIFFQIREYHDPIAAFSGLSQIIGLYLTGSALLFVKFCRTKRAWQLTLATLLYGAGLLTYELTLIALPLLWFLVPPRTSIKRRVLALRPFLLLTGLYLVIVLWLRHATGGGGYEGVTPSLDWKKWHVTFGRQLFASVPFSYWIALWHEQLDVKDIVYRTFSSWSGWLVFAGNLVLLWALLLRRATFHQQRFRFRRGWRLFAVGLVLLVCPAAIIALSKKYQNQLVWGTGYLPVYISYFGMALLTALILFWLLAGMASLPNRLTRPVLRSIVIGASLLIAGNRTINLAVAKKLDAGYKSPRDLIEAAAQVGAFNRMTNGDTLLIAPSPPWVNENYLFQHTERAIEPIFIAHTKTAQLDDLLATRRAGVFLLDYRVFAEEDRGWLMLSRINRQGLNGADLKRSSCKVPSLGYSLFVKSDREFPAVRSGHVRLKPVEMETTNMLRRIYATSRAPRYFALSGVVSADSAPCPDGSGELEAAYFRSRKAAKSP